MTKILNKKRYVEVGDKFGRLTLVERIGSSHRGRSIWHCECECGMTATAQSNLLLSGNKRSCGCLSAENLNRLRHGATIRDDRLNKSPRWRAHCAWVALRARCLNPSNPDFARYGGRGITFDSRWEAFENFLEDMGEPPPKTSLDRKDNDGSYCKDNCRWGTKIEQMSNRSNCRYLTYNAETKTAAEWARHLGIGHSALLARINRGWPLERVLSERSNAPSDASTVVRVALLDGFSSGFLGFGA